MILKPSKSSQKKRIQRFNVLIGIAIILAALLAFNSTWKGYDETRLESYQNYQFTYENGLLVKIGVNNLVFNVDCDKVIPTKYSCILTDKRKMREFKTMVNR